MRERQRSSFDHLIRTDRWRGGFVPYGYVAVKNGKGYKLEKDPQTSAVLDDIVSRVIDGDSINGTL